MKTLRTPTIKATVNYDPALLKSNHIYLAATDNEKIYVDDLFHQMPLYVRIYLLLHEEGHIIAGHPYKRDLTQELEADQYAVKKMSKILVHKALLHKDGGYATSLTYVDKLCSIIERWKLTQYDVAGEASDVVKYYRVRKNWDDAASQLGAYTVLANAKAMADKHTGYEVYDWNGKQIYPEVADGAAGGMTNADCPFLVKVSISDLNIRKGAGTNTAKTGICTGGGVFTIMEVREGKGSDTGWGRLKSGAGWVSLDYCQRV